MPLLNDAKTCYVGTTPITTIMAGSVQVWPKGPSPPVGPFDRLKLYSGTQTGFQTGAFLSWETPNRPSSCSRGLVYTVQEFELDPSNNHWYDYISWNDPRGYNWMPLAYPNVMAIWLGPDAGVYPNITFRLKYESSPGVYEYSSEVQYDTSTSMGKLPTDYQQDECNGKPRP